ncbi:protein NO VEIN domain-containing protein [Geothrix mesophila]|uniref:protein NO VEIN domain-containing protein n=1 Tax=Geothrix mesophila TaxID=2922723 RepID=UPI001FADE83F|nr:DUF3883 domain-containing protein [Geothrix sp. SG198]
MTPDQFQKLAWATNQLAESWDGPMGSFLDLRRQLKGAIKATALFGPDNIKTDYAFHWGGRGEFQLSTGIETEGAELRVGLAFSLEGSAKTRGVPETLRPKIERFNSLVTGNPTLLANVDHAYWVHTKTKEHHRFEPGVIPEAAIRENVFIFLGHFFPAATAIPETLLEYWDKVLPLYEAVERSARMSQKAWALYSSQDGERSFQCNEGYADKLGEYLSFDNQVANSLQVKVGDRILIIDGCLVYGTSLVDKITSGPADKIMKVCPECETTTLSPRKTLPGSKCTKCGKVWDAPKTITKVVTAFRAFYGTQWAPFNPPLSRDTFDIPFTNKAVQNAIRPLDGDALARLLGGPSPGDEVEQELSLILGKPSKGKGFAPGLSSAQKKAVENRAMEVAKKALEEEGWEVEDTSLGNPFDLLARRSDVEMHVEVKGTCTTGEKVVLTRGEVKHHNKTTAVSALYVVSAIKLGGTKEAPVANDGTLRIIRPWAIDPAGLESLAYEYTVPREPMST